MLTFILILLLAWVLLLLFIITSAFVGFILTRVPFVPTSRADVEFIVKELGVSPKDVFYDLGSGDGKVVFLMEKLSGAKTKGFEMTWWTYLLAKIRGRLQGSRAEFARKNFFKENWSEANMVYAYLYPPLMRRVEEKFVAECRPGSVAIVRDFPFPGLKPSQVFFRPQKHEIYIYKL